MSHTSVGASDVDPSPPEGATDGVSSPPSTDNSGGTTGSLTKTPHEAGEETADEDKTTEAADDSAAAAPSSPPAAASSTPADASASSQPTDAAVAPELEPLDSPARSHSSESLLTDGGECDEEEPAEPEPSLSSLERSGLADLLEPLHTDAIDPNRGLQVLTDLFTSGKVNEAQYQDLRRKHKYLQSMFWACVQSRATLRESITEAAALLREMKAKARADSRQADREHDMPEIQTVADLDGRSADELKKLLATFDQERKSLDNSIYQYKFKTKHLEEERSKLEERVQAQELAVTANYFNSPAMMEKDIRELGGEIRVRRSEIKNLTEDIDAKQRLIPQKEARIRKLEEKMAALKDEREELLPKIALLARDADREEKQGARLRKQADALAAEVLEVVAQLKEVTEAAQKADQERNDMIRQVDREYRALDARQKDCVAVTRDVEACRERCAQLADEKGRAEGRMAALTVEVRREAIALRDLYKAVERLERDLRISDDALKGLRDALQTGRGEAEKLQRVVQQQAKVAAELPIQRQQLQKEVDLAHADTNAMTTLSVLERQNLQRLAKERAALLRLQDQLQQQLDGLGRQRSNLVRVRDSNARLLRKVAGEVAKSEDELRNRVTIVDKFKKKCNETEKETKQLAERYEVTKKERDEVSSQLNISLIQCEELRTKTDLLQSQQDTMLSRKLELERQHDISRQATMKTILEKTMTQTNINQERETMRQLEAQADQLTMMIGYNQMALNAIKESIMVDLEEYKRQVVDRNERGLLLVERDEEVCAFQEKINLQDMVLERGGARLDTAEKDIVELNKIIASERHHVACLRARQAEVEQLDARLADTRCQMRRLNSHAVQAGREMETPARRQCRHLAGPPAGDGDVARHLGRVQLQLYAAELRLLERQMVADHVARLNQRARDQTASSRESAERLMRRAGDGRRAVERSSRKLRASAAEAAVVRREARRLCQERNRLEARLEQARRRMKAGLPPFEEDAPARPLPAIVPLPVSFRPAAGPSPRPNQYLPSAEGSLPLPKAYGAFSPFKPPSLGAKLSQMQRRASREQQQ